MHPRLFATAILASIIACGPGPEPDGSPAPGQRQRPSDAMMGEAAEDFDEIRRGFLEWYFEAHPVRASELGVHDYDARMPDLTRRGIQRRIDELLDWLADLEEVPFDLVADENRFDYAILEYGIRAELLDLEEARGWANDPRVYTDAIAKGLATVAEREYAPFTQRVRALVSRMDASRAMLSAVRPNLRSPPRLWTEMAVADARGLMEYVDELLPRELAAQTADPLPPAFEEGRAGLLEALDAHLRWLVSDLLPRSTGTYRLGRYLLERKLLYSEHVSLELEELERLNRNAIDQYRSRLEEVAREIDPDRTSREIMDSIGRLHPAPEELVATARAMMTDARDWVLESGVVDITVDRLPTVRDSPPYARDAFASLDAPGPFDSDTLETFYNLTNTRPEWDEELVRQHMSHFSYGGLHATTFHETFPGRYVQHQHERELSDLRKVFTPRSFTGGWASYAAEMALEEGASDDPAVRLGQLQRSLQRHARWYAVIRLHAMNEPLDRVVRAFMEIAYFDEFPARREVIRATSEPTMLGETLGRMQILQLRDDYRQYLEEAEKEFSLVGFHRELLRLGLPLPLAREALMPRDREPRRRRAPF